MDMTDIDRTIKELEKDSTTFENCQKLASLYIVRQFYKTGDMRMVKRDTTDIIYKELSDILPHYNDYCRKKREFQLHNADKSIVLDSLNVLCQEITEFLHILYVSTDMPAERHIIEVTLKNIQF